MDWKQHAEELLAEYDACCRARPYHNALDVELAKEFKETVVLDILTDGSI